MGATFGILMAVWISLCNLTRISTAIITKISMQIRKVTKNSFHIYSYRYLKMKHFQSAFQNLMIAGFAMRRQPSGRKNFFMYSKLLPQSAVISEGSHTNFFCYTGIHSHHPIIISYFRLVDILHSLF